MSHGYSMRGVLGAAERAAALCRTYLLSQVPDSRVHDVQQDPRFQHRGVDLLWEHADGRVLGVEVKGDRQGRRGNYFFELVSNLERDTPGCFLYTTADLYLYAFLDLAEVHHLPLPATRDWFLDRAKQFELRHTKTRTGKVTYTTVGALVPVNVVQSELESASRWKIETRYDEHGVEELAVTPLPRPRRRARAAG